MMEAIRKAVGVLENTKAGWASRREAADMLSQAACTAAEALYRYRTDPDVDVRRAVETGCARLESVLKHAASAAPMTAQYSLEELVNACRKPGVRDVRAEGDTYVIDIRLESGRHQTIYVKAIGNENRPLVRVLSFCAPYRADMPVPWMLRANARFAQAAIALVDRSGEEWVAVINSFLEGEITPQEMKAAVKEVAFYADWLEQKLSGKDNLT